MVGLARGEETRGGVGGHGLVREMIVSVPSPKKLESSLIGEPGCGPSTGRGGITRPLVDNPGELLVYDLRLKDMAARCRTKKAGRWVRVVGGGR